MELIIETRDGRRFRGPTPESIVRQMMERSPFAALRDDIDAFIAASTERARVYEGIELRAPRPEKPVADRVAYFLGELVRTGLVFEVVPGTGEVLAPSAPPRGEKGK